MIKFINFLEIGFFITLFGYLYLVSVEIMQGSSLLPFHDGILLIIAIFLAMIRLILSRWFPYDKNSNLSFVDLSLYGVIALQILLILQLGAYDQAEIKFGFTILALCIYGLGGVFFIDFSQDVHKYEFKYLSDLNFTRVVHLWKYCVGFVLGFLTVIPWVFWLLSQIGLGVNYISVVVVIIGSCFIVWQLLNWYIFTLKRKKVKKFLLSNIPNKIKTMAYRLSFIMGGVILLGVGLYVYFYSKPLKLENNNISLIEASNNWSRFGNDGFSTEAAFYPNQSIEFKINVDRGGLYAPSFKAQLSDLGGQVNIEIVNLEGDNIILNQKLDPFQCKFWLQDKIYESIFGNDTCPNIFVPIQLKPINLEADTEYMMVINVSDEFSRKFNPELKVEYGGYVFLEGFELIDVRE